MHQMNIADRRRDAQWALAQFERAEYSLVAVNGEDGYPYNLPLIVFRVGEALYFHTAMEGRLNDLIKRDGRASVTCVTHASRDPENTTMRYRSAMVTGVISPVEGKEEKMRVMKHFFDKYLPDHPREEYFIDRVATIAMVYRITVEEAVGKESLPGHNV